MQWIEFSNQAQFIDMVKKLAKYKLQYGFQCLYEEETDDLQRAIDEKTIVGRELQEIFFTVRENKNFTQKRILEWEKRLEERSQILLNQDVALPLCYLFHLFELNSFERHCILLTFAYHLEKGFGRAFSFLHDEWELNYFTPYLARLTFPEELGESLVFGTFSSDSKLMKFFLKSEEIPDSSQLLQKLYLDPRIVAFGLGSIREYENYGFYINRWEYQERLEPYLGSRRQLDYLFYEITGKVEEVPSSEYTPFSKERKETDSRLICLLGEEGIGKKFLLKHLGRQIEKNVFFFQWPFFAKVEDDTSLYWELARECLIFQGIPAVIMDAGGQLRQREEWERLREFLFVLSQNFPFVFICLEEQPENLSFLKLEKLSMLYLEGLSPGDMKTIWEQEGKKYPLAEETEISTMANRIMMTPGKVKETLKTAYEAAKIHGKDEIDKESLQVGCYRFINGKMNQKANLIPAFFSFEDLILPNYQKKLLKTLCNQVRNRYEVFEEWGFASKVSYGKGVSVVFCGPPGTGKTMAAQVIARNLGMDLYKVNLSTVVSKYVGETEKNLNEIFEQAGKSQVILFFDEADVLFSKRTEVKEANDKYSNMEAAFLLQKIEYYEGIIILATNFFNHFDEAFKRRIKFVIEFPFPGAEERKELWQSVMPLEMPREELDLEYLASHFEFTGSNIKNVMLHSAFLAAVKKEAVGMQHIIPAIKNEYAKNGKILSKEDVLEYYMFLESH